MTAHECEDFDFPVKTGPINYTKQKTLAPKLGGTWQIAEQDAIDEAKAVAEADGVAAMANETCKHPCQRFIYVESHIANIMPKWIKKGKVLEITITGTWEAGILCFKPKKEEKKKEEKKKD